jgi:ribosome biogenesis GTPase A
MSNTSIYHDIAERTGGDIYIGVVGPVRTGKSTLINNLIGKAKAITGNKAGVTRGKQWFNVNDYVEILDTPGTLYPKLINQRIARHLAYVGSIKEEVVDVYELSMELLSELNQLDANIIKSRYGFTPTDDGEENLKLLAKSRGFLLRGGEVDSERASSAIIEDFRKGRLGKITLDKVKEDD